MKPVIFPVLLVILLIVYFTILLLFCIIDNYVNINNWCRQWTKSQLVFLFVMVLVPTVLAVWAAYRL